MKHFQVLIQEMQYGVEIYCAYETHCIQFHSMCIYNILLWAWNRHYFTSEIVFLSWLVNKGSKKVIKVNQVLSSRNIVRISIKLYTTTKDWFENIISFQHTNDKNDKREIFISCQIRSSMKAYLFENWTATNLLVGI